MAEFPAFPLFTDAYLGDTTHLTTIEHGAYLLLLMVAWRSRGNKLPNDDRLLARYTKCTASQWKRIRPILEPFFSISSDGWSQGRLMDEANHVRQVRESQIANGRASALKRKGRHSTKRDAGVGEASTPSPSPQGGKEESNDSSIPPRRATRLPDDWHPKPLPENVKALADKWPEGRLQREIDGFKDYWKARSRDNTRKDWDLTFHNRIRDQHDRIMRESQYGKRTERSGPDRPSNWAVAYDSGVP